MTLTSIPVKTPEGLAELRKHSHHLSQRHRTVLLLVDGRRALLDEVELRIPKPQRMLTAQQTLGRVRQLLYGQPESQPPIY